MIQIIGHRGASAHKPENTIAAFEKALSDGAAAIELDVRRSKGDENNLVVIHDSTVSRTTNGQGRVKRLTFEQLQELDAGDGEKIPLLEEVLEHFAGRCQIFIEIKSRQIATDIAALITEMVMLGKWQYKDLIVICFYPDVLEKVRKVNVNIPIGVHLVEIPAEGMSENIEEAIGLKPEYILPSIDILTDQLVKKIHAAEIKVATWAVNTPEDVQKVTNAGVDAIISDNPAMVKREI